MCVCVRLVVFVLWLFEQFQQNSTEWEAVIAVFVHKEALLFLKEQLGFSQKAREHRQPCCCLERCSHAQTDPSLCPSQCVCHLLSNKKLGFETMLCMPLLL